jgi:hypothetical protein
MNAREVVEELLRRQQASEDLVLDDLVAEDMINHAAGPQGRSGLALGVSRRYGLLDQLQD